MVRRIDRRQSARVEPAVCLRRVVCVVLMNLIVEEGSGWGRFRTLSYEEESMSILLYFGSR
mgnify:CR=1 FL=1